LDDVTSHAIETAVRARRYHRIELMMVACTTTIVVVAVVLALFFGVRQSGNRAAVNEHTDCVNLAVARFVAAPETPGALALMERSVADC
jgi:hypothetical protein